MPRLILASTSRYFDRDKGEWVDGRTEWFTVRVFRGAAALVKHALLRPLDLRFRIQ